MSATGEADRTATDRRFPGLDGLRGLAAIAILFTHVGFASGRSLGTDLPAAVLGRLDFGVAVFFLLSGFLLSRPFICAGLADCPKPSVTGFWIRRALRIFPALWICVAVTLALITERAPGAGEWLHYLLLIQVYDHHQLEPMLSALWTLSAEIAFYAVLPLLGWLLMAGRRSPGDGTRRVLLLVGILVAVAVTFNAVHPRFPASDEALLWAPAYLDWFAGGMLLALLSALPEQSTVLRRVRIALMQWAAVPGTCFAGAAVLWLFSATQLGAPRTVTVASTSQWTIQHYLFLAAAMLLMIPLVFAETGAVTRIMGRRLMSGLGRLSYGVFLWHLPLLTLFQRELGFAPFRGHFWPLLALTTVGSLAVAAVSWRFIERPILRHGGGGWRRSRTPARTHRQSAASVNS